MTSGDLLPFHRGEDIMLKSVVFPVAMGMALAVGGCAPRDEGPAPYVASEQVDRGCILSSSDKLRQVARIESSGGRALPAPDGKPMNRIVELDATNAGLKVTYVFACLYDARMGMAFASPMGRK